MRSTGDEQNLDGRSSRLKDGGNSPLGRLTRAEERCGKENSRVCRLKNKRGGREGKRWGGLAVKEREGVSDFHSPRPLILTSLSSIHGVGEGEATGDGEGEKNDGCRRMMKGCVEAEKERGWLGKWHYNCS